MTTHPTDPPSTDRPLADPGLALMSALNSPPYDLAAGRTGTPLGEAAQLLDDYRAAVLREGADAVGALDRRKLGIEADTIKDAWEEGRDEGADLLRDMAAGEAADTYRVAVLREAANALAAVGLEDSLVSGPRAWTEAIETLRRMASATEATA